MEYINARETYGKRYFKHVETRLREERECNETYNTYLNITLNLLLILIALFTIVHLLSLG
jgi:large-conductance mechanosensitive channel